MEQTLQQSEQKKTISPLVKLNYISQKYNCAVYGKLEIYNPTGTHKDRASQLILEDASNKGYKQVGCASTGNAAISLAAYARMKNLKCNIWISKDICEEKFKLIKMFNPILHIVKGDYHDAIVESNIIMKEQNIYNANPGVCNLKLIGNSFIGQEIMKEISPDHIICPTNNGSHLKGVWRGVRETNSKIKMVAATAKDTNIASSISGFHGFDRPLEVVRESNGALINVNDLEMKEACQDLLQDGIIAEVSSAAAIASLKHLNLNKNNTVCCVITGNGMKYPQSLQPLFEILE